MFCITPVLSVYYKELIKDGTRVMFFLEETGDVEGKQVTSDKAF